MRASLFVVPLLLASAGLAQAPGTVVVMSPGNHCPVGMTAQREAYGRTEWIVSLEDSRDVASVGARRGANTGVYVELNALRTRPMSKVKVAVDFTKPVPGVMPVDGKVSEVPDLRKTFEVAANEGSARELSASLLVGSVVFVTRVHLLGITYADGSTWAPAEGAGCSVRPSLLLSVEAR